MLTVPPSERQCEFGAFPKLRVTLQRYSLLQVDTNQNGLDPMILDSDDEYKHLFQLLDAGEAERLSRPTRAEEVVRSGECLHKMLKSGTEHYLNTCGDTGANRKKAASLCYRFFQVEMGISQASARAYIRCFQKFGENAEATRVFSYSALNAMAGKDVSGEIISAMVRAKLENPEMTREELVALFNSMQSDCNQGGKAQAPRQSSKGIGPDDRPNANH